MEEKLNFIITNLFLSRVDDAEIIKIIRREPDRANISVPVFTTNNIWLMSPERSVCKIFITSDMRIERKDVAGIP